MSTQHVWHVCFKCNSLFFAGGTAQSVCAAGGAHSSRVFDQPAADYFVDVLEQTTKAQLKKRAGKFVKSESGWRRCRKCECLFHAELGSKGVCPADGHGHEGFANVEYQIALKSLANPKHADARMRKCKKCLGMFWDSNWMAGVKTPEHAGVCPAKAEPDFPSGLNKAHNGSGSSTYAIGREPATSELT
jgi:hypothetical protein